MTSGPRVTADELVADPEPVPDVAPAFFAPDAYTMLVSQTSR